MGLTYSFTLIYMTESKRKALQIGEILRVEIEKVAHGGHFIARHEGAVIFVRHGIPGEIVEVRITGLDKSFARGDVIAVIEASPSRVQAPCSYAGVCGGCDFQHIEISRQRSLKSEVIAEQFARISKMEVDVVVEEVSTPLHWRTRYAASSTSEGELGFSAIRSNSLVPISSCPVLIPEIDFPTLAREKIGKSKRLEVAIASNGERSIAIMDIRTERKARRPIPKIVEGGDSLSYEVLAEAGTLEFQVSQSSFWQSNINAPERLVEAVLTFADLKPGDHLLDLYGGVGLFAKAALPYISESGEVEIIEGSATAVADANRNFAGASNVKIHSGDVAKAIRRINNADVIVLDPPRTGAGREVVESLANMGARAIVYVACDPAALARDTSYFADLGYQLEAIRAFDLFPMTHHIESVALFAPRKVS